MLVTQTCVHGPQRDSAHPRVARGALVQIIVVHVLYRHVRVECIQNGQQEGQGGRARGEKTGRHTPHAMHVTPIHSLGGLDREVDLRHCPREHVGLHTVYNHGTAGRNVLPTSSQAGPREPSGTRSGGVCWDTTPPSAY